MIKYNTEVTEVDDLVTEVIFGRGTVGIHSESGFEMILFPLVESQGQPKTYSRDEFFDMLKENLDASIDPVVMKFDTLESVEAVMGHLQAIKDNFLRLKNDDLDSDKDSINTEDAP